MMIFQLVEIMATLTETVIGELIVAKLAGGSGIKWKCSMAGAGIIALIIWAINQFQLFSVAASIAAIVGYTVSAHLIYKSKVRDAMLVSVDYVIVIYIVDFLILSVFGVVFQENQMAVMLTDSFSFLRIWFLLFSKGILAGIYIIFSRYFYTSIREMTWKMWLAVSIAIIFVYCFVDRTLSNTDIDAVFIWMLLLAFVILAVYSFMQYISYSNEKFRIEVAEEGNQQIKENYETLIQFSRDNQIFYHDLKNHYVVIDSYLNRGKYEDAKEYMKNLKNSYPDSSVHVWTGITSLDTLIQCKKKRAESFGIEVEVIADRIHLELAEYEIITLIGNALDNAIEACQKIEFDNRWIRFTIRKIREMIFIKVVNSCLEEPKSVGNHFTTSKQDKIHHGFGTISMQLIVDKYEGVMRTEYKDGVFALFISFF